MSHGPLQTPMERAPIPDLGTEIIPKERYTSPEFAARAGVRARELQLGQQGGW